MLTLTRKDGEGFWIEGVYVRVTRCKRGQCRVSIDAPREVKVVREELRNGGQGTRLDCRV